MSELTEVVRACNVVGKNRNLVQGTGGNVSLKLDDKRMLVKASGLRLDEITEDKGIVKVDYAKIKCFMDSVSSLGMPELEIVLGRVISSSRLNQSSLRPSMETSFHALLGKAVVHTHPVTTNLVTCMNGGYDILRNLFNNLSFYWIEYKSPGYFLANEINKKLIGGSEPSVFFLEKHGLIVSSDNFEDCVQKTLDINRRIAEYFGMDEYMAESDLKEVDGGYSNDGDLVREFFDRYSNFIKYLFPDAVVYGKNPNVKVTEKGVFYGFDRKKSKSVDEIMLANMYLMLTIPELNGRINCLCDNDISYLLEMEAEKYRQEI